MPGHCCELQLQPRDLRVCSIERRMHGALRLEFLDPPLQLLGRVVVLP